MKKAIRIFSSMPLMGFLMLVFFVAIGIATFIENDFGSDTARAMIYNALWFEILLGLLTINLMLRIYIGRMYQPSKLPMFIFHLSFLIILIGAGITRFIGFEGTCHIRQGETAHTMLSDKNYVMVSIKSEHDSLTLEKQVLFAPSLQNTFHEQLVVGGQEISIQLKEFIANAGETVVESANGTPYVWMVLSGNQGRINLLMAKGETKTHNGIQIGFGTPADISIDTKADGTLFFTANDSTFRMAMANMVKDTVVTNDTVAFWPMHLYSVAGQNIVLKNFIPKGKRKLVSFESSSNQMTGLDALIFEVTKNGKTAELTTYGKKGIAPRWQATQAEELKISIAYGPKQLLLPFGLHLKKFELERYPGSNSPSSYASEVILYDEQEGLELPYRIYMNHVLDHRGYRFFQSSFDQDEKGTVLSVNHDKTGTLVSYLGYLLMGLGMFVSLFWPKSRFKQLVKLSSQLASERKNLLLITLILAIGTSVKAQNTPIAVDKEHAKLFGTLLVQDNGGRIKPLNTFASEVVRKVTRNERFLELAPEQVVLGMLLYPREWQNVPMIKIGNPELKKQLNITGKYASFASFFDGATNMYLLQEQVKTAAAKKPAEHNKFDKEILKVDERLNICYMAFQGNFMRLFPLPNDPNNTWYSIQHDGAGFPAEDSLFVAKIFTMYAQAVQKATSTKNYREADEIIGYIKTYQEKFGAAVVPSPKKQQAEIRYNNLGLFNKLAKLYGTIGFVFLIMLFIKVLAPKRRFLVMQIIFISLLSLSFIAHAYGLGLRWYISGHAPWSNGYESMLFIAWVTVLAGLIFVRRSAISLAATAVLASLTLFVAHLNWMDPEITPLVPVLKSYWLMIHVAIITASYGFLALGCLLGFFVLLMMVFRNHNNNDRLKPTIRQLTAINEMTLTVGLFMLTVGTFLGGVWANESWGRYWGWDPKETWALATILLYAFILHMRFMPGLKGAYALNVAAMFGYLAVLMTYFGVNYYLSGLHSYAKGDPMPIPMFAYYTVGIMISVAILAYWRNKKLRTS